MENKRRIPDGVAVTAGLLLLLLCGLAAIFAGGGEYDEVERRYLADRPGELNLADWKTDRETEAFLKDHTPARHALVALDSCGLFLTGRNSQLGAWVVSGAVVEPPVRADARALESKLRRFSKLAEEAGVPWWLVTPESHGFLLRKQMNSLLAGVYAQEAESYAYLAAQPQNVTLPAAFSENPEEMYYRTDHHWTLRGAYQAYLALAEPLGYEPLALDDFRLTQYEGFHGTTLSRSGLPGLWQDTLLCAEPTSSVQLICEDRDGKTTADRLIFPEAADGEDGYAVYLNGNHGVAILERPDAPEGTLIVFRDSMASCLLPLLSQHFRRVIAVDARYDTGTFSEALARSEDTKAVLFLYSLESLVNDTEITRKAR